jgi:hypothetical protein
MSSLLLWFHPIRTFERRHLQLLFLCNKARYDKPPPDHQYSSKPNILPAAVDSLTACNNGSNFGSKATVQAVSIILPAYRMQHYCGNNLLRSGRAKCTIDLCAEIYLHYISILEHSVVAGVGGVMSGDVIDGTTGRKADATLRANVQSTRSVYCK